MGNENKVSSMQGIGSFLAKNKVWTNFIYGVGAAVVLVGALFKILHLPGASQMLSIGMSIEACLFLLSAFELPHKEYDWEHVYPELAGGESGVSTKHHEHTHKQVNSNAVENLSNLSNLDVSSGDVSKMTDGIRKFGDLAEGLNSLDEFTLANQHLVQNMKAAAESMKIMEQAGVHSSNIISESVSKLASSYSNVVTSFESDFAHVAKNTKSYSDELSVMGNKLASLNAVYELQLKAVNEQLSHIESMGESVIKMNDAFAASVPDAHAYRLGAEHLKSQIENLNSVYGNMLNALSVSV